MVGPMVVGMVLAMLLPILLGAAFFLFRYVQRRRLQQEELSPVTKQHIDLLQGGHLNEAALEDAKLRFRELLERGEVATVEASLRPGMNYIVQVRALAEIGTDDAGRILERQLKKRLTDDKLEQSWYWIDLASSLRALSREESLPHLLRCADQAVEIPLGHFFAAETICFLGFPGYLRQSDTTLGRSALRLLHRALEGLRLGVQPQVVVEARLGEILESLWDDRSEDFHPLMVRVAVETLRFLRRAPHAKSVLADEIAELEAFEWQMSRLNALEPVLEEYLEDAALYLPDRIAIAKGEELEDTLRAINDLRADAGTELMALLLRLNDPELQVLAIEALRWSDDPRTGAWLRDWIARRVPVFHRGEWRRRPFARRRSSLPMIEVYLAVLRALRGQGSRETEAFLLIAARDFDPSVRATALSSLGWWEPLAREQSLQCLKQCRRDTNISVRQAARAAAARLGERLALQWFRQALTSENNLQVHEAIQVVAGEGLTLLWPDLDRLADSDDIDIAIHAREALEQLSEEMPYS